MGSVRGVRLAARPAAGHGEGHHLRAVVEVASLAVVGKPHVGFWPFPTEPRYDYRGGNCCELAMLVGVREFGEKGEGRGLGVFRARAERLSLLDELAHS